MAIMTSAGNGPFPEFGVKEISLFNLGQQTKVNIKVVLKDRGNKFAKWFTKSTTQNLYLKVVQITDSELIPEVLTEKTIVSSQELKTFNQKNKKEHLINIKTSLAAMGLKFNMTQLQKFFVRKDNGANLYEIPMEFEFIVDSAEPETLEYFFIPKITGKLYQASSTNTLFSKLDKRNSLIKREVVINGGQVSRTATAYILNQPGKASGVVWSGAVHFMGANMNRPMTGISHSSNSQYLSATGIPNTKIKDFRLLNEINSVSYNKINFAGDTFKKSIFSRGYFSRTYYDSTTGYFSMNTNNLLKSYISFSNHFDDSMLDLKDFASLASLKITRRKVEINDGEVVVVSPTEVVREYKNPNKAFGAGNTDNKFSTVTTMFNDIKLNNFVKTFDFHDELEQAEGAKYQYGVEGTIIDLTSSKIKVLLKQLSKRVKDLLALKSNAEKEYNYSSLCYSSEFINTESNSKIIKDSIMDLMVVLSIGNKSLDIQNVVSFLKNISLPISGNPDGIEKLINIIDTTTSKLQSYSSSYLSKKPGNSTGTPQKSNNKSLKSTKEIKFSHFFKDIIGADSTYYGYEYLSSAQKLSTVAGKAAEVGINYGPSRNLSKQEFLERINLETEKYFVQDSADDDGAFSNTLIPQDSGETINPNDSIERTKYTFLTPALIKMSQVKIKQKQTPGGEKKTQSIIFNSYDDKPLFDNLNVNVAKINLDQYNEVVSKIIKYNKTNKISLNKINNEKKSIDAYIKDLFSDGSVVVTATSLEKKKEFKIFTNDSKTKKSFSNIKKDELKIKKSKESLFMFSVAANSDLDYSEDSMSYYDINSSDSAIAKPGFSVDSSKDQVAKSTRLLPNQVKSLMFNMVNSNLVKKNNLGNNDTALNSAKNFGAYALLYKNLVIIEYLSGYELDESGAPNVSKELWAPLDLTRVSSNAIENTLCRIRSYELPEFNIKKINLLQLPIYDEYFKITNENFNQAQVQSLQSAFSKQDEMLSTINSTINGDDSDLMGGGIKIMPEDTFTV